MKVFVTRRLPDAAMKIAREAAEVSVWEEDRPIPRESLMENIRDADGLLCMLTDKIDAELLERGPKLKVVSQMAVGLDNIDVAACAKRNIAVGNTPDVLTDSTADIAFGLMLATARRMREAEQFLRDGQWKTWSPSLLTGADAHHATLGIVGMGRIGYEAARRARGFSMNILYSSRRRNEAAERDFGARFVEFDVLLAESDFISLHCPLTPETRHLIGPAQFAKMKPSAILINTARGAIVDQAALSDALLNRRIAGAGLDVFEIEPLPLDDPLLQCENVTLTPHIGSASVATRAQMAILAAENLVAGIQGRPLPHECWGGLQETRTD